MSWPRRRSFASAPPCAGRATTADDALLLADVDDDAVYTHGGSLRAGDKFFGSTATRDGTPVPGVGNPRLPRVLPLRVRTEFRMLVETLKQTLALGEARSSRRSTRSGATST